MSSQFTKITSCDLRSGILKGLKSQTNVVNKFSSLNNRKFTTSSSDNNESLTKKARSQVIREKKATEKQDQVQSKLLFDSLNKEYDGKSYANHYRDDEERLKYFKSPYSGRELPFIPSTLDLLTNGYSITEEFDEDHPSSERLTERAKRKNGDEFDEIDEIDIDENNDGDLDVEKFESQMDNAQVNLDNVHFEFVPSKKAILHPEIAKLSKPNQIQFIKMVETISKVFTNLDSYLHDYASLFTKYELTYFETAMKVLRTEYIENEQFRKSFTNDNNKDKSTVAGLNSNETFQANKDVEILLTNLLKELYTKKARHGLAGNGRLSNIKKNIEPFTSEERDDIKEDYCRENKIELDEELDRELDLELDEMEQTEFEDDVMERSRFLEHDMNQFMLEQGINNNVSLFDHLKTISSQTDRQEFIGKFVQFKQIRDSIRSIPVSQGSKSLTELVKSHIAYMNTENALVAKMDEMLKLASSDILVRAKLSFVEQTKINSSILFDSDALAKLKETDFEKYTFILTQDQPLEYSVFNELFDGEESVLSYIDELQSNLDKPTYNQYQHQKAILLSQLEQVKQEKSENIDTFLYGKLTGELEQLLNENQSNIQSIKSNFNQLTNNTTATAAATTESDATEQFNQQLDELRSLLQVRIQDNYILKKGEKLDNLTRLKEGIEMFKQLGMAIDLELVEKIIFQDNQHKAGESLKQSDIKEQDIYEPVQLIKALYKLGPNKFQDTVEGLKRLPNMVYYCQYINDRFLDPNSTYIAPLSMFQSKPGAIGERLDFNDDDEDELSINDPYIIADVDQKPSMISNSAVFGEEGEVMEQGEQSTDDQLNEQQQEEDDDATTLTDLSESLTLDIPTRRNTNTNTTTTVAAAATTTNTTDQSELTDSSKTLYSEKTIVSEGGTEYIETTTTTQDAKFEVDAKDAEEPEFFEDVKDTDDIVGEIVEMIDANEETGMESGEDFRNIFSDRSETTAASPLEEGEKPLPVDEMNEANEIDTSDLTEDTEGLNGYDMKLNSAIIDNAIDEDVIKMEAVEEMGEYDDEDSSNELSSEEDPESRDTVELIVFPKDEAKIEEIREQLAVIKNSFPFFGVDDGLDVSDVVFDDEENEMETDADTLFLLEAGTLLRKGNILKNPSISTNTYLDLEEHDDDEDEGGYDSNDKSPLEEMGYEEDELDEEDDEEENDFMMEQNENEEDNEKNAENMVADAEMQQQYKSEKEWRDTPSLHISNLVDVSRHVKVTKAGRVSSYSCTVFNGDGNGSASLGYGKGDTASSALRRASRDAERNAFTLDRYNDLTLPSGLDLKHRSTKIRFFKSRDIEQMDYRGMKQNVILPTIGLHGVTFRTYGRRGWDNVLLTLQKCLPGYTNPEEAARIMGKRFVTPGSEKSRKKTLSELLQSKLENRNNDPYNLGMVSKFLYDVEEKPNMEAINKRRQEQELRDLFDRYPQSEHDTQTSKNQDYDDYKFNNNRTTKRVDSMKDRGRKHERNISKNSL